MSYRAYEALYLRPHHQHQPPPEYGGGGRLKDGSINTLFVSGLPEDVKPREIYNLFRRRPGFVSCQLKYTGVADQVVTFFNHQSAVAALHALNGVTFDPFSGEVLHIELARSNSRRKQRPDKRRRSEGDSEEASSHDGDDNNKDAEKEDSADEDISGEEVANTDDVAENVVSLRTSCRFAGHPGDLYSRCLTTAAVVIKCSCTASNAFPLQFLRILLTCRLWHLRRKILQLISIPVLLSSCTDFFRYMHLAMV